MTEAQMILTATKKKKRFEHTGSRASVTAVARDLKGYGWTVSVEQETDPRNPAI
jgi:hypothetical protein